MLSTVNKGLTVAQRSKQDSVVAGRAAFNPLTFDAANLLALYDGDTLNTDPAGTWSDQSANGFDLTLFNAPTIISPAINGHDALQFNGVNQYARRALTPVRNQPTTIYIVFKHITFTVNDRIFDGTAGTKNSLEQTGVSPNLSAIAGVALNSNPDVILNSFDIITTVFNSINSEIRTNNNVAVIGDTGLFNDAGITLAANSTGAAGFGNCEIAYFILRTGADNTATQNIFINYLKNRFAI